MNRAKIISKGKFAKAKKDRCLSERFLSQIMKKQLILLTFSQIPIESRHKTFYLLHSEIIFVRCSGVRATSG